MCGIAGIAAYQEPDRVAQRLYLCAYNLLHRGQDSSGIVVERSPGNYRVHTGPGTIDRVFLNMDLAAPEWHGFSGLAHTRYATSGVDFRDPQSVEEARRAAQPIEICFHGERAFMAYNGNLSPCGIQNMRRDSSFSGLDDGDSVFARRSWVDTELIVRAIEGSSKNSFLFALAEDVLPRLQGAFSMIFLYRGSLIAVRDAHGFRPLEVGMYDGGYVAASEDNMFNKFPGCVKARSVQPGECVIFQREQGGVTMQFFRWASSRVTHFCQFEQVYFMRFDSHANGGVVSAQRKELGRTLCRECPPPAGIDFVVGVPDSGIDAGYGYALEAGLPFDPLALRRLHGAGRTFLEPVNDLRKEGIDFKLVAIPEFFVGKRVLVVDDSIVRGVVTPRLVYLLKECGACEVHMRSSSPPVRHGCWYGIDTYRIEDELVARGALDTEAIRQRINAAILTRYGKSYQLDSLCYLSLEGMQSVWKGNLGLCDACWTGNYPVK